MGIYRFGPLGRMLSIPIPQDGYDDAMDEIGVIHQALSGVRTKDVFGYKRTFGIPLEGLGDAVLSWFEMAFRGSLGAPLYLMDEHRVNRLTAACSSTLSAWSPYAAFTPTTGAVAAVANTVETLPAGTVATLAPAKAASWVTTAAGVCVCQPSLYTPVVAGEDVVFSGYALTGAPTLELVPFAKTTLAPGAAIAGTVVVAGAPARRYVTYHVPSDGSVVAVRPQIRVAGAGTVTLLALQLERGTVPGAWVQGSGVPKVIVAGMPTRRRRVGGYEDGSITLQEA